MNFSYETVAGNIGISWKKENGYIRMSVKKDKHVKIYYDGKYLDKDNTEFLIGEEV